MIKVEVKPRQDDRYDIFVGDEGDQFVNSSQGYENVEDAERIVRRLWSPLPELGTIRTTAGPGDTTVIPDWVVDHIRQALATSMEPVVLKVTYRNGKTKTEQIR